MMKKIGLILALFVLGCAKSPEYDTVYKSPELTSIEDHFDTKSEYLYVPMTLGAPREVAEAMAFFQGEPKIVKIKFEESGLEVFEEDNRDINNPTNNSPVLSIPGTYHAFKCATNQLGECTNREEEDIQLLWNQRPYFKPKFQDLKVQEINLLNLFSVDGDPCLSKIDTKLVDYTMEKGVINIELERTYKTSSSFNCIFEKFAGNKLRYSTFKVRFYYSLIKLESLTSKDYEPINYPTYDQYKFGFFNEEVQKEDPFINRNRWKTEYLLRRWNAKKGKIIYHLGKNFFKKDADGLNSLLKDTTYKAFNIINGSLEKAQAGFRLEISEDQPSSPGDIRYNIINLIDENVESGLLGYGPTVSNPRTGEILRGMVNMYSGVIREGMRSFWQSMVVISRKQNKFQEKYAEPSRVSPLTVERFPDVAHRVSQIKESSHSLMHKPSLAFNKAVRSIDDSLDHKLPKDLFGHLIEEENRINKFSKNCAYTLEFMNTPGTAKKLISGILDFPASFFENESKTILKSWDMLTLDQKKEAQKFLIPHVYLSTLVHEMGHNLGLRHNFEGSYDKDNFYSQEEATSLGIKVPPGTSSIMDYLGSDLGDNLQFGKYDIAALRFGYAREVETEDGTFIKVIKSLLEESSSLKKYDFCTDENVGTTISCNRFDEGTSSTEIAKSLIERYEDSYAYQNFRDGRTNFKNRNINTYLYSRYMLFKSMRAVFENWERLPYPSDMKQGGCPVEFISKFNPGILDICHSINDANQAVDLIGNFFLDVLRTPDHLCDLAKVASPKVSVKLTSLSIINTEMGHSLGRISSTCFDPAVKDWASEKGLVVRGEVGKFLNHQKEFNSEYMESGDLSALGIWVDKLLAIKFLTQRFNEIPASTGALNFYDFPNTKNGIQNFFMNLLGLAPLQSAQRFVDEKGEFYDSNLNYTLDFSQDIHVKDIDVSPFVRNFFSLPMGDSVSLSQSILENAKKWDAMFGSARTKANRDLINFYTIHTRANDESPVSPEDFRIVKFKDVDYYIYLDNNNYLGLQAVEKLETYQSLMNAPRPALISLLKKKKLTPAFLVDLTSEEREVLSKLDKKILEQLLSLNLEAPPDLWEYNLRLTEIAEKQIPWCLKALRMMTVHKMRTILQSMREHEENMEKSLTDEEKPYNSVDVADLEKFLNSNFSLEMEKINKALLKLPTAIKPF